MLVVCAAVQKMRMNGAHTDSFSLPNEVIRDLQHTSVQVRVQLFQGSPVPSDTRSTGLIPPINATDEKDAQGQPLRRQRDGTGAREYALPLYQGCALQVERDSKNTRTGDCMEPERYMKVSMYPHFCLNSTVHGAICGNQNGRPGIETPASLCWEERCANNTV